MGAFCAINELQARVKCSIFLLILEGSGKSGIRLALEFILLPAVGGVGEGDEIQAKEAYSD